MSEEFYHHKEDCEQVKSGKAPCPFCIFSDHYYEQDDGNIKKTPFKGKRKNTRKWCKGKVGKPHQPKWEQDLRPLGYQSKSIWLMYTCQICRKVMDSWMQFKTGIRDIDIDYERPEIGSFEPKKKKEKPNED